ncbi:MAG: hypothetical protein ACSLE2_00425 [Lysobacterales bacterium]
MQIDFGEHDGAVDILEQVRALLCYQNQLLLDFRGGGGLRVDRKECSGAVVFNELLQAMVQAAIDKGAQTPALRAVNEV